MTVPEPVTHQPALPIEERYRRALEWIRVIAGMHYFGLAFEPEHMRDISNMACDALDLRWDPDGGRLRPDLPGYAEHFQAAMEQAGEMAELFGRELATPGEEEPGD